MGQKFIIHEFDKKHIKKLYGFSDKKNINIKSETKKSEEDLKYEKIQSLEITDCKRVREEIKKENVLLLKIDLEKSYQDRIDSIKNGSLMELLSSLISLMTWLCLYMQIMTTSKSKNWGIPKEYFKPIYDASIGIENHFNTTKESKVKFFLDEFRKMYNNY